MPRTRTDAANRRLIERWRNGLASTPPAAPKLSTGPSRHFIEVVQAELATTPATAPPSRELHIEIALPCGAVVRIDSSVEEEPLRRVLRALA